MGENHKTQHPASPTGASPSLPQGLLTHPLYTVVTPKVRCWERPGEGGRGEGVPARQQDVPLPSEHQWGPLRAGARG